MRDEVTSWTARPGSCDPGDGDATPLDTNSLITRLTCYLEAPYQSAQDFRSIEAGRDVGIEWEAARRIRAGPGASRKHKRGICTTNTLVAALGWP